MDKKHKITTAIEVLGSKLSGHNLNWIIGGSGSLLVHGLDVVPNDIDLVVDPIDYRELERVLSDILMDTGDELFVEKTTFIINGIYGNILVLPINKELVVSVKFGKTKIFVHKLNTEYKYYKNRTDKVESNKQKIDLIEKALLGKSGV